MNLLTILIKYKDDNYKKFQEKICFTNYEILGIRIPILRKISYQLIKEYNNDILLNLDYSKYFEFILIEGFIIANIDINIKERLELITKYLAKIDNWAICDTFCSELKLVKNNKETFFNYLQKVKQITKEYYQRFYIVILLQYYIDDKYINYILEEMLKIKSDEYYVKMAISWCLSICLVKYYELTINYLKTNKLTIDKFILNKTISKACDSYRLTKKQKRKLKQIITKE